MDETYILKSNLIHKGKLHEKGKLIKIADSKRAADLLKRGLVEYAPKQQEQQQPPPPPPPQAQPPAPEKPAGRAK